MKHVYDSIIIGGGAAGFFAANVLLDEGIANILILEKSDKILSKVKVSGGGRCNFTHNCLEPETMVKNYPRGKRELQGPFTRFGVRETLDWFEEKGLKYKVENDGRMFPQSNSSQSIIDILTESIQKEKIEVILKAEVIEITKEENHFKIILQNKNTLLAKKIIICTGGFNDKLKYQFISNLGHKIITPVASLFTINVPNFKLKELMGLSVQSAGIKMEGHKSFSYGPLLITHWGFSGPVVLKQSSENARELSDKNYECNWVINWTGKKTEDVNEEISGNQNKNSKIVNYPMFEIPKRLWMHFCKESGIPEQKTFSEISKKELRLLSEKLCHDIYPMKGKTTFKEEFVTCGGVDLKEIDFKTMQSKIVPGLYFAGEVLNIDGITGGFNFQSAWTGAWHAAKSIAHELKEKH